MKTNKFVQVIALSAVMLAMVWPPGALASTKIDQTPIPGSCIPKFYSSLPVFGPAGPIPRVNANVYDEFSVIMKEINQSVLPPVTINTATDCQDIIPGWPALPDTVSFGSTRVWAYEMRDGRNRLLAPAHWPAVTVEARRHNPSTVTYVNQLPRFNSSNPTGAGMVQGLITIDQSIHWADPLANTGPEACGVIDCTLSINADSPCCVPYTKAPPAVVHLHGGEVSSRFDGGPEAWMTPAGSDTSLGYNKTGTGYDTLYDAGPGKAVYFYPNEQEPGTLWFHDHALGATRTNVYSGMAAFYFLRDPSAEPKGLPHGAYEIEMAIQDRQFDTNSQLFFPDGSGGTCTDPISGLPVPCANFTNLNGPPGNPNISPFWIPEFLGDVVIVNGAPWPKFQVEPRRYRLRLLNGSNARMYVMHFGEGAEPSPPVYVIGQDDSYLDKPVNVTNKTMTWGGAFTNTFPSQVFFGPGERVDVIVDFTGLAGQSVTLVNFAPAPFPEGLWPVSHTDTISGATVGADPGQSGMHYVMQFQVTKPLLKSDDSCNPALGGRCGMRPQPMTKLTDGNGNLAPGVTIDKTRQLVLKEFEDPGTGSPVFVLVNNTFWNGTMSPNISDIFAASNGISELPRQGATELWEIINLTTDEHPMHTHLAQFQVLNRQPYNATYLTAWGNAFADSNNPSGYVCGGNTMKPFWPSGDPLNPCPGYGPPFDYLTGNSNILGGNPDIGPFLIGDPIPPAADERVWKDTAKADPRSVLRIVVRWTPTSAPVGPYTGQNLYPFDPKEGDGYVWHCHIIDHEDNEMMRPYKVTQ